MKHIIFAIIATLGLSASADVGDYYSTPAKIGRNNMVMGMAELVNATYAFTTGAGPVKMVKGGMDIMLNAAGDPFESMVMDVLGEAIGVKFTVGLVYDTANVTESAMCLGKDHEYTSTEGNGTVCYVVQAKDIVIK